MSVTLNREGLRWYHWDGAWEYVGAKNEALEKESELGDGIFANGGKRLGEIVPSSSKNSLRGSVNAAIIVGMAWRADFAFAHEEG